LFTVASGTYMKIVDSIDILSLALISGTQSFKKIGAEMTLRKWL